MRQITHQDMIKEGQTGCYGEFEPLPIYEKGRIVNRDWYCRECGLQLNEMQMMILLGETEQ